MRLHGKVPRLEQEMKCTQEIDEGHMRKAKRLKMHIGRRISEAFDQDESTPIRRDPGLAGVPAHTPPPEYGIVPYYVRYWPILDYIVDVVKAEEELFVVE